MSPGGSCCQLFQHRSGSSTGVVPAPEWFQHRSGSSTGVVPAPDSRMATKIAKLSRSGLRGSLKLLILAPVQI